MLRLIERRVVLQTQFLRQTKTFVRSVSTTHPVAMATTKKAVIFDLGGVVIEPPQNALVDYGKKFQLPQFFIESIMIKGRPDNSFCKMERGELTTTQFCEAFQEELEAAAQEQGITIPSGFNVSDLFTAFGSMNPVPAMLNAIVRLRECGLKTCALTNNYIDDTKNKDGTAEGMMILRMLFDEFVESCRVGVRKPDPVIFEEACRKLQITPEEAVFLDDIGPNVKSARALGFSTILVKDPQKALNELQEHTNVDVFKKALPIACHPDRIADGFVTTADGVRLHYFEMGQGPPIILCHGFPDGWYSWRRQIPALALAGYRVIALELKGYGDSSCPPEIEEYSLEKISRDVVSFMDIMALPQVTFVGHDWGGALVWGLALHYPERTKAVAGINTPFFPPHRSSKDPVEKLKQKSAYGYQVYFQKPGVAEAELGAHLERFFKLMVRASRQKDFPPGFASVNFLTPVESGGLLAGASENPPCSTLNSQEDVNYWLSQVKKSGLRGMLNWYRNVEANKEWNARGVGRKILSPALMVTAERDVVLPPSASRYMDPWIPNLTRAELDCGHWTLLERPVELNNILLKWLGDVHNKKTPSILSHL